MTMEEPLMQHRTPPAITVATMQPHDLEAVVELLCAQQQRQAVLDPRLPAPHAHEVVAQKLSTLALQQGAWVAHDQHGQVRGAARAGIWELCATSMLQAFLTPRNGITQWL